jgi:ribose transport system substrate-binding protein
VFKTRAITVLVTCGLITGLAACGSGDDGAASGGGGDKPLIGFSVRFIAGNSWLSTLAKSAAPEGEKRGYKVETVDAQGNAARQIQQMQTFLNKGAKAIIIEPVEDRGVAAGIAAARRAKVPVIVVNDRVAPDLATQVSCNIFDDGGATSEKVGEATAKVAAERFAGKDSIKLYIQAIFPQELVTQTRENGFMKGWNAYFKANPGPKTVRVPNNYGKALPDATLTAMRNVLAAHPDIDVIFNQTDVVMGAVKRALTGAKLMTNDGKSEVVIAGFDGGMDVIKSMADDPDSPVVANGLNQPPTQAAYAVEEAVAAIDGKKTGQCEGTPPNRVLPPVVVTPETAKDFVDDSVAFAGAKAGQ